MSRCKKNILKTSLFIGVFGLLVAIASLFDLQISQILATNGLQSGTYYSTNFFGKFFEYIGSFPIFFLGAFACLVFMHHFYQFKDARRLLALLFLIIALGVLIYFYYETLKYVIRFIVLSHSIDEYMNTWWAMLIYFGLSVVTLVISVIFYHKVKYEDNRKLFNFAYVIIFTCVLYLVVSLIKGPIGRMRFRAMALIGYDFSYYTPWFVVSDAKEIVQAAFPVVPNDGFKSFPSGHTFSAGVIYTLICLPDVFEKFNTKKWRILWYVIPVVYTGIVAISRIVVGAHFMSDVLFGGTLAYVGAELGRYIFITRNLRKAENIK